MQMIVASRLKDGRVVFMGPGSRWVESIDEGIVTEDDAPTADLLAEAEQSVKQCAVVDPYLIEIAMKNGRRRPVLLREAIRAFGPSVRDSETPVGS